MFLRRASNKSKQPLSERGDTIVEVLVAIGVMSMVLGGAYVTTNHSLQDTRAAQEQQNAVKLVQSQVEQLKSLVNTNGDAIFGGSVPASYCISGGAVVSSGGASCVVNTNGIATTTEPVFHLSIVRATNTFTVTAVWEDVGGKMQDNVQMRYRVYAND